MAKCGQTAAQFITEAFRPRIAVMASPEVEAICMKNDLTLTELLQPFSKLSQDGENRVNRLVRGVLCLLVSACVTRLGGQIIFICLVDFDWQTTAFISIYARPENFSIILSC